VAQSASAPRYGDASLLRDRRRPGLRITRNYVDTLLLRITAGRRRPPKSLTAPVAGGRPAARDMEQAAGMSYPARSSRIVPLVLGGGKGYTATSSVSFPLSWEAVSSGASRPTVLGYTLSPLSQPRGLSPGIRHVCPGAVGLARAAACDASRGAASGEKAV
jgi:hypothetical protein